MGRLSLVTGSPRTLGLPAHILRQPARLVPRDTPLDVLRSLVEELLVCLYEAGGAGIAAPQAGVLWRLFVLRSSAEEPGKPPLVLVNPVLTPVGDALEEGREGCLSLPGYVSHRVPRAMRVRVEALDHRLQPIVVEAGGWLARGLQHECDHLDGILYTDRLTSAAQLEPDDGSGWLRWARGVADALYEQHAPAAR